MIALDGNLTVALLAEIGSAPGLCAGRFAGRARLSGQGGAGAAAADRPGTVFYVNLEEAGLLCGTEFAGPRRPRAGCWRAGRSASW